MVFSSLSFIYVFLALVLIAYFAVPKKFRNLVLLIFSLAFYYVGEQKLIIITAIKDGKVIDTSMGFTPLDGIEMGSRCGSIDPAIVPFIMEKENLSPKEMQNYMNKECGLLGVSGVSGDMRLLMEEVRKGNPRAVLAYDILIYDIQKYIGGYVAALNGVDAIAFTAGIGENTPELRRDVINGLGYLGVKIDEEKNLIGKNLPEPSLISTPDSRVKVYVVKTDEELVIASDTRRVVEESKK